MMTRGQATGREEMGVGVTTTHTAAAAQMQTLSGAALTVGTGMVGGGMAMTLAVAVAAMAAAAAMREGSIVVEVMMTGGGGAAMTEPTSGIEGLLPGATGLSVSMSIIVGGRGLAGDPVEVKALCYDNATAAACTCIDPCLTQPLIRINSPARPRS